MHGQRNDCELPCMGGSHNLHLRPVSDGSSTGVWTKAAAPISDYGNAASVLCLGDHWVDTQTQP